MVRFRIIIGTIWVSILLIGRGLWAPDGPPSPRVTIAAEPGAHHDILTDEYGLEPAVAPARDLYGNPIEPAVGDYRTDPRGDVYERHAPDTAVLRLGPPGV